MNEDIWIEACKEESEKFIVPDHFNLEDDVDLSEEGNSLDQLYNETAVTPQVILFALC